MFRRKFTNLDYEKLVSLKSFDDNDITFYFLNYGDLYYNSKVVYSYHQNMDSIWNSSNELERSILNAIDFEIILQILKKDHNYLITKYFKYLYFCYTNKYLFDNTKYERYKNQCIQGKLMDSIMNWNSMPLIKKVKIKIVILYYKFMVCFFSRF